MNIRINISQINYGDIVVKAMPSIVKHMESRSGAVAMAGEAAAEIPEELIRSVMDAVPVEKKNTIVAEFVKENRERVVRELNRLSARHRIGVMVSNVTVSQDLQISVTADRIDYRCMAERFLPAIKEKLLNMGGMAALMRPMIERASADQIAGLMERLWGSNLEPNLVFMINQNQQKVIAAIEGAAKKQDIRLKIRDLTVHA